MIKLTLLSDGLLRSPTLTFSLSNTSQVMRIYNLDYVLSVQNLLIYLIMTFLRILLIYHHSFFIEKISDHRGKLSHRQSLQFFVSWMVYNQLYDSWEPYGNLRDSTHLHSYLREKNLTQLIPTKFH